MIATNLNKSNQRGLSLVEMMVAITIGLILIAGVGQIFVSSNQTYRVQNELARLQESGRFAMEFLSRDIRMADYWGCAKGLSHVVNNLNPAGTGYNSAIHGFSGGLSGTDGGGSNSDTIILRIANPTAFPVQSAGPQASANIQIAANNPIVQGDILVITDCAGGDIFQVSNANPGASGTLVHNTGNTTNPGNYNPSNPGCPGANAHCLSHVYGSNAQIMQTQVISYFIQADAANNNTPTLYRQIGTTAADPLAEGVENIQILYGEDTDEPKDYTANRYVAAGTAGLDMEDVVSVRIAILVRTPNDNVNTTTDTNSYNLLGTSVTPNPVDRRLRRVFTSTIQIRNRGI